MPLSEFTINVEKHLTPSEKTHLAFANEETIQVLLKALIEARVELSESPSLNPEQLKALKALKDLGKRLSGQPRDVHLASRWGKDPDTGEEALKDKIVLNTATLQVLAGLSA